MPRKDGTPTAEENRAELQAEMDALPAITRCGIEGCSWSWEGTAGDGREMFKAHRRLQHRVGVDEPGPESTQEELETSGDPELERIRDILGHGEDVEIRLPVEPEPWRRTWIESLGGRIVIEPDAPIPLAMQNDREEAERPEKSAESNGTRHQAWTPEAAIEAIRNYAEKHGHPPPGADCSAENGLPSTATLTRLFGSLGDAIEQAGFPKPKRGQRYEPSSSAKPEPRPAPAPEPLEEPAALPAVVPQEPSVPSSPRASDPDKVDTFELFESLATEERIDYYEAIAANAIVKAEALRAIRDAVKSVRELEPA